MVEWQPAWTLYGIAPGFAIGAVLAFTLAAIVYLSRPDLAQNRWLALLLVIEALSSAVWAVLNVVQDPAIARATFVAGHAFMIATMAVYPLFLGTLETPLARPMRNRYVLAAIWMVTTIALYLMMQRPDLLLIGPFVIHDAVTVVYGPGARLLYSVLMLPLIIYALLVVLSMWRRAPKGSALHSRSRAFVIAFVLRDSLLLVTLFGFHMLPLVLPPELFVSQAGLLIMAWTYHVQIIGFPLIAGYGILKHQLFDIDLKIKWTIKRSTLVALFVAFFFVVSESAALFLGERWGPYLGIVAAGLLLFALAPLQRLVDRFADATMPHVSDSPAYIAQRKEEVYRATLQEIARDGRLTDKERDVLARLSDQLGISAYDARRIERSVLDVSEVAV